MNGGTIFASTIAANEVKKRREEEERMNYTQEDLTGWEFKILRATTLGGFKNPNDLKRALDEEAQNGWQLLEKFDDYRIRLKRKASASNTNTADMSLIDPYRTVYGPSNKRIALITLAIMCLMPLLIAFVLILFEVN